MAQISSYDGVIPVIDPAAFVHPAAVVIGDVIIGPGVYVAPCASLRGDLGRVIIERDANIQDTVVVHGFPGVDTVVGENGHIGHGAIVHACVLERNVLIGMNAVVMDFARIGESSIVAAAAFVPAQMVVPARSMVVGMPARVKRELTDDELSWKLKATEAYHFVCRESRKSMVPCTPLTVMESDRRRTAEPDAIPLSEFKRRIGAE